ncbi:hypothetical protein GGX14DRAFT_695242 [Mycena pura]|uniref:Protein kinase domain-containing protein n=1 Tax=Mycena pura TaxID=153505 RepID=A0AAD6VU56_9AGAR|nr:hypothetical protein GGX14DRAFT_695242 [Mycena pura]
MGDPAFPSESAPQRPGPWPAFAVAHRKPHSVFNLARHMHACIAFPSSLSGSSNAHIHSKALWTTGIKTYTQEHLKKLCTPHQFKRFKVLRVGGSIAFDLLVEQALQAPDPGTPSEFHMDHQRSRARENESVLMKIGHATICFQQHYVMIRLTEDFQLQISRVYQTYESATQAKDMAELVLFYTHSALGCFDGDIQSDTGFNNVTISDGRLVCCSRPPASTRKTHCLYREYAVMRSLEGVAIPRVVGLYTRENKKNMVLILMSYTGKPLETFSELLLTGLQQAHTLLHVHESEILHNDFEPRNVTMFGLLQFAEVLELETAAELSTLEDDLETRRRDSQGSWAVYKGEREEHGVMSYAGKPLETFSELLLAGLSTGALFRCLLHVHEDEILYNDFEPRNVTMFGLLQVAEILELETAAELSTLEDDLETCSNLYTVLQLLAFCLL